jgi:hypothetical protein
VTDESLAIRGVGGALRRLEDKDWARAAVAAGRAQAPRSFRMASSFAPAVMSSRASPGEQLLLMRGPGKGQVPTTIIPAESVTASSMTKNLSWQPEHTLR